MRDVNIGQDGGRVENLDQERRTLFIKSTGRSVREAAQRMFKQWRRDRSVISMLRNLLLVLHQHADFTDTYRGISLEMSQDRGNVSLYIGIREQFQV